MTCMMWTDPSTGGVASSNRPLGMNDGDLSVTTRVVLIGLSAVYGLRVSLSTSSSWFVLSGSASMGSGRPTLLSSG